MGRVTFLLAMLASAGLFSLSGTETRITWVRSLPGDFSFARRQSISCEAWCYEWAGTTAITAKRIGKDTLQCYTAMNTATHCSLHLIITKDSCAPTIVLKSIVRGRDKVYPYKSGYIKIDSTLWKKGILKATFDFDFVNDENEKNVYWKGRIYTRIR